MKAPTLRVVVKAGQVYEAPGRRGKKLVKVRQVRAAEALSPYAIAHEVDADGARPSGRDRHHLPRGMDFHVHLTWSRDLAAWVMPPPYVEARP